MFFSLKNKNFVEILGKTMFLFEKWMDILSCQRYDFLGKMFNVLFWRRTSAHANSEGPQGPRLHADRQRRHQFERRIHSGWHNNFSCQDFYYNLLIFAIIFFSCQNFNYDFFAKIFAIIIFPCQDFYQCFFSCQIS